MRASTKPHRSKRLAEEIANTRFERILGNASQFALIGIGLVVLVVALQTAQVIIAPVFAAIIIGLVFGPIADILDRRGIPDPVSAAIVVVVFLGIIAGGMLAFAAPLSDWTAKLPLIWARLQSELANWQEPLAAFGALQEQVKGVLGGQADLTVAVEDSGAVLNVAMLAPAVLSQIVVFLLSLYFFMATRDNIRISALSLCVTRRLRWRMAHVFRDIEQKVSRYLLTITMVNVGVGIAVTIATWALGMPTPLLWGAMAAVLNYVPFVGQGAMAILLFLVGMGTSPDMTGALLPVLVYFGINFVEGNFVTPNFLGRTMTINPFLIFLSLAFWIWVWGPVGGLIAVPSLLILHSVATHILPMGNTIPVVARRKLDRLATIDAAKGAAEAAASQADAMPKTPVPRPARRRAKPVPANQGS